MTLTALCASQAAWWSAKVIKALVRHGSVTGFERSTFRAVNDLPAALYPVLWPFQQLGVIVVGVALLVGV